MARTTVSKRLVFHVGGYDPITPHAGAQRRFVREIARFQRTWSVKASLKGLHDGHDPMKWNVTTTGPNWRVENRLPSRSLGRRDRNLQPSHDLLAHSARHHCLSGFRCVWRSPGYLRTNWYYAGFFLYPFVVFGALILVTSFIGLLVLKASGSIPVSIVVIVVLIAALLAGPWRWLHLDTLFDDWSFSREYVRKGNRILDRRLDKLAAEIVAAAGGSDADELVVVGHSLGAVLAVDLLDRALVLDPTFGRVKFRSRSSRSDRLYSRLGFTAGQHAFARQWRVSPGRLASSGAITRLAWI